MVARRLVATPGFRTLIIGGPQSSSPFRDIAFHSVRPAFWKPGNVNTRFVAAMTRRLRRVDPALIEVHNRPEIAVHLARRLPRVPVTLLLNNDPQTMRKAESPARRRVLLRQLALVMTSSEYLRTRFLDGLDTAAGRVAVLPNSIDLAELPPSQPRDRIILFAGRIVHDKGPDTFVAACAAALPCLPDWRAEMIGADRFRADSPDTEFTRLTRAAAERAGVHMFGYRDHSAVLQAMACAAIVVVPSRWQEPFGLVALEALASGAALICADRGGLREVAGDAAVYVPADDPQALSQAIVALARDPERRLALEQAGRQRAQRFDAPVIAARMAELRREVLAAAGG
jgi:glycosyltransferase involved in cell wall biosynthesis